MHAQPQEHIVTLAHKLGHAPPSQSQCLHVARPPLFHTQAHEIHACTHVHICLQDEVERALAREIAHLHAVTAQINHKANAIDKELENLEIAAATIEDNIRLVGHPSPWALGSGSG